MSDHLWTHEQFDEMSWHDNHVHGLRFVEGLHGTGRLVLDLDYILEWLKEEDGAISFRVIPVSLTFVGVTGLRISLDYATPTAALVPFSIHAIERRIEQRERYQAQLWKIVINWPVGEFTFEAEGYEQRACGTPVVSSNQWLNVNQRRLTTGCSGP